MKILKIQKQKEEKEELDRKIQLIQQIKQLEKRGIVAHQKDVDHTETSGLGLLGEMSVLEVVLNLISYKKNWLL
jgi:predicted RNase H-like nuclease (RuvC/YqgF family)